MNAIQGVLTSLLLPPTLFLMIGVVAGLLAWRGSPRAGMLAAAAALGALALSTPLAVGLLQLSLERDLRGPVAGDPRAIIILGGDVAHGAAGHDVGPLTLERLRAGAALQRSSGLPILVTGGVLGPGQPALAELMARSLAQDFQAPAHWVEAAAADTRDNATLAVGMLRAAGIESAWLVSQGWHLPRASEAFARLGFPVLPAPVRLEGSRQFLGSDLLPRPDHLGESWYAIREWAGRLVYRLRDGAPAGNHLGGPARG
jgi:uncharacterized SAM-binding protein YcdF (DUF218 family)